MVNLAKRYESAAYTIWGSLLVGLFGSIVCIAIQYSSLPLSVLASEKVKFNKIEAGHWSASLDQLAPGTYYISAGRPRSLCDLVVDGKVLSSTRSSDPAIRESLLLGGSIVISQDAPKHLAEIRCSIEQGFAPGLTHVPLVLKYPYGILLQLWRAATDLLLGIFCSAVLILTLVFRRKGVSKNWDDATLWLFAFSSFVYSLSLAHFPRLLLSGPTATTLHACLRVLFGWSFFLLCTQKRSSRIFGTSLSSAIIGGYLLFASNLPAEFESFYDATVPLFSFITFIAVRDAYRLPILNRGALIMRYVATTWLIAQLVDISSVIFNKGPYLAPAVVALMTVFIAVLKRYEDERLRSIETVSAEALRIINGPSGIESKLRELGLLFSLKTSFQRVSVYADAFVLGSHDRPHERFVRVMEYGYLKDTSNDRIIDFDEQKGTWMKQAIDSSIPQLTRSKFDGAWFSNVPLGTHAILNLSDAYDRPAFLANESHDLVTRVLPALESISDRLVEYGARMGFALEILRLTRGDGTWTEEIGCVFIDVNGYDDNLQKFGEPYGKFLTAVYLPALCQRVRKWCVRESSARGDGVYLICIADLMQERCNPPVAVYRTLEEILRFVSADGADMCAMQGYEPVRIQIGANAGVAHVICDSFQVRTNGATVNIAARLQAASQPGQTLVNIDLAKLWPGDGALTIDEPFAELKKTRRLSACRVHLKKKAA